ncbi:MAG: FkbM family methyltransferase [Xanthobacteraceae bacterium]
MRTIFPQEVETELKRAFLGQIQKGYFVDVGAFRPEEGSQTYDLEQQGWSGVLIEPQPKLADDLRRQRTAKVITAACSSRRNSGTLMTFNLAGGHSSFDPRLNIAEIKSHDTIEVKVRTLDEVLAEAGTRHVDFVSIDVEGHEIEVLDGFDLARWRPRLILIEDFLLTLRLHRHLQRRGYRWLRRTGINNWYVPADGAPRLGPDGWWQFFNKFYLGTPFRRVRMAWRRFRAIPQFVDSDS